ncbi:MAG: DUF1223 domain-containing protein [Bacteroidota bacterium]
MKVLSLVVAAAAIIIVGFVSKNKSTTLKKETVLIKGSYAPVAVLELFTSEGCSSCPPADNLLPQLSKLDSNVIPLSFHVDYWNRLGWTDPFSSSEYSDRQRDYSRQFNLESIYTPQLVVNGEYELVGSSRGKAESTIKNALKEKATVRLMVDNVKSNNGKLSFSVFSEGEFKKTDLLAALVQKQAVMNVKTGENRGSKLLHTNVVRSLVKQTTAAKNEFELTIPENLKDNQWELVIYAQQKNDLKISGAVVYNPK